MHSLNPVIGDLLLLSSIEFYCIVITVIVFINIYKASVR